MSRGNADFDEKLFTPTWSACLSADVFFFLNPPFLHELLFRSLCPENCAVGWFDNTHAYMYTTRLPQPRFLMIPRYGPHSSLFAIVSYTPSYDLWYSNSLYKYSPPRTGIYRAASDKEYMHIAFM